MPHLKLNNLKLKVGINLIPYGLFIARLNSSSLIINIFIKIDT